MSGLARSVQGEQLRLHINVNLNDWPGCNAMFRVNKVATYIAMRCTIYEPVIVTLVLYNDIHNTPLPPMMLRERAHHQ
jgi:hypothetical protein